MTLRRVEGALVRTLGLIERRGFAVTSISTSPEQSGQQLEIILEVESTDRSVEVLIRQVARLLDVCVVAPAPAEAMNLVLEESVAC